MKVFKTLGVLLDRRDAQWVRYRRNPDLSSLAVQIIEATLSFDKPRKDHAA